MSTSCASALGRSLGTALWGCLVVWAAGCQMGPAVIVGAPLSVAEQQRQILELAPLGTSREEVAERLQRAGLQISPSSRPSLVYCDLWQRPDGALWHMNVALLFDDQGRLYDTRPAEAETAVETVRPVADRDRRAL